MENQYLPEDEGESDNNAHRTRAKPQRIHPLRVFSRKQFRKRYRLTKPLARFIIRDFISTRNAECRARRHRRGRALDYEDKFCIALSYLATGANMNTVADQHKVHLGTVSKYVTEVVRYLYSHSYKFIKWPVTEEEKIIVSGVFEEYTTKPRCLGIVDGTQIPVRKPHLNAPAYIGKSKYPTLNTMVVCDYDKIFIHVDSRFPGSVQDAFVFNSSDIKKESIERKLDPFFLIADKGYGCQRNMFTPVLDPTNYKQRAYNRWHRTTRVRVEIAIGQLKNRWRCLDDSAGYLFHSPTKAGRMVVACCCLHNLCEKFHVPMEFGPNVLPNQSSDSEGDEEDANVQNENEQNAADDEYEHNTRDDYIEQIF